MVIIGLNIKKYMYYNIIVVLVYGLVYDVNIGTMDFIKICVVVLLLLYVFILIIF